MTGEDTDESTDADQRRPDRNQPDQRQPDHDQPDQRPASRDRDSDDEDGGFVFGDDAEAEPRSAAEQADDAERRIRVDLQSTDGEESVQSGPPGRDPGPDPTEPAPDPGPNAVRNWTLLLFALSLTSFATAAATYTIQDAILPVVGATVLGLGFAAVAILPRNTDVPLLEMLSAGWIEHRRYTWFATGLFAFGILVGALLLLAGIDLLEFVVGLLEDELPTDGDGGEFEITATDFIVNNTGPFLLSIVGGLSLGVLTAVVIVFNGIIVGNISAAIGGMLGFEYIVVALAPHGIFELTALFLAAGVGFRLIYRLVERILDKREAFLTKPYAYQTLALVGFAWLLLVLAAFVEAYITPELLEVLFAEELEGSADPSEMP